MFPEHGAGDGVADRADGPLSGREARPGARGRTIPKAFPTTADVPLVVEVADTTLPKDRALALTYAREGIPVYWLINMKAGRSRSTTGRARPAMPG